jgi:Domain of unknown function (DUF4190)
VSETPPPPGWEPPTPPPAGPPPQPPPPGWQQGAPPPQAQWGQPPPQWGPAPGYQYGYAAPQTESSAVVALVLAIAAWVVCPVVPAVVALFVANSAEQSIRASGGTKTGDGLAKAARIISWVHLGLCALGAVVFLVILIAAAVSSS